ncbi:hypothetical protein CLAIMM_05631 [Cladophialophora immunda]|nr:hypothetical protein CLAIMM_05631 [Cladophialophora immunda]
MFGGASELFNLLLTGGADLQHCDNSRNTSDFLSTIWELFLDTTIADRTFQLRRLSNVTACMQLTDIALSNGCEIGSNVPYNGSIPSPLFARVEHDEVGIDWDHTEVFKFLIRTGFDKEERNDVGQTPLLFVAAGLSETVTPRLEILLSLGADATAIDRFGRGALHSVLMVDSLPCRCGEVHHGRIANNNPSDTDLDLSGESDFYSFQGTDGDLGEREQNRFAVNRGDPSESETGESDEGSMMSPSQQHWHDCDGEEKDTHSLEEWYDSAEEGCDTDRLDALGYSPCLVPFGTPRRKVYPKLLLLLKSGCDPNLQDADGRTPSDYVWRTHMWADWERALMDSGWIYDANSKRCVRHIEPEDG